MVWHGGRGLKALKLVEITEGVGEKFVLGKDVGIMPTVHLPISNT